MPDSLAYQPVIMRASVLEKAQSALVDGLQIEAKYDPMGKPTSTYILNPLAFVQRGVRSYLVATKEGDATPIPFAVQRFRGIEILESAVRKPKDFTLKKYLESGAMDFGGGGNMKLKAVVSETLATYLNEAAISADQKVSYKSGKWILTATVRDSWQLWFWLRSQGNDITVLQPKSLRDEIVDSLKSTLKNYE
ncbi:MAG: WYL domain-containing protein [Opitutales bacterium]|nr:WYL domain-containing protein [Opitutales bacterium]